MDEGERRLEIHEGFPERFFAFRGSERPPKESGSHKNVPLWFLASSFHSPYSFENRHPRMSILINFTVTIQAYDFSHNTTESNPSFGRKTWLEVKIGTMVPDCIERG